MTRILGVDPGLAETGWGVIDADGSRYRLLEYGSVKTSAAEEQGTRLTLIYTSLAEVIRQHKPQKSGVEEIFFARNRTSAIPVAEARGVILLLLAQQGIPAYSFSPPQIKLALTGSGSSDKKQVQEMVRILLGLKDAPNPEHASDALASAICCYNMTIREELIGKGRREC